MTGGAHSVILEVTLALGKGSFNFPLILSELGHRGSLGFFKLIEDLIEWSIYNIVQYGGWNGF